MPETGRLRAYRLNSTQLNSSQRNSTQRNATKLNSTQLFCVRSLILRQFTLHTIPVRVKTTVREGHGKLLQPNISIPSTTLQEPSHESSMSQICPPETMMNGKFPVKKNSIRSSQRFAGRPIRLRGSTQKSIFHLW